MQIRLRSKYQQSYQTCTWRLVSSLYSSISARCRVNIIRRIVSLSDTLDWRVGKGSVWVARERLWIRKYKWTRYDCHTILTKKCCISSKLLISINLILMLPLKTSSWVVEFTSVSLLPAATGDVDSHCNVFDGSLVVFNCTGVEFT